MKWLVTLWVAAALCVATAQDIDGPAISTEGGGLRITSPGDVVFQVGDGGSVSFQSAGGAPMSMQGEKGESGAPGAQGPAGPAGAPGTPGPDGSAGPPGALGSPGSTGRSGRPGRDGASGTNGTDGARGEDGAALGIVSWNQCAYQSLNSPLDYGLLATCLARKSRNDTWLRITWNGNMRITRCQTCCMRWYFTINGAECSEPGPIDAVIFQSQNYHIVRQSDITGICRQAGGRNLTAGAYRIQFSIKDCNAFGGFVYDAYTGWNSVSRIIIEEYIPRAEDFPEVLPVAPPTYVYQPHYCQFFYSTLSVNQERNLGTIVEVLFNKQHDHTVLKFTWEGSFRKKSCSSCCSRWWITIDGSACSFYERIETTIASSTAYDVFAPTTLTGICSVSEDLAIEAGSHLIRLEVGNCPGSQISNAASGFFSTSRLIVEEIPQPRDPQLNAAQYHPQWSHCAVSSIPAAEAGRDDGPFPTTACSINKTSPDSALRVTFNGNIRLTGCDGCCMRWFVTINGSECVDPGPIDGVLYTRNSVLHNVHRGATITGICRQTENGTISSVGLHEAVLNVGMCEGFNESYNAYTGFQSASTMNLEELPTPRPSPPADGSFYPNWLQCVTDTPLNTNVTNDTIMDCTFTKQRNDTVLKIAWDGNIALEGCIDCCMRWFLTVNGEECSNPGPIDGSIRQDLNVGGRFTTQFDTRRPATIAGICRGTGSGLLPPGNYTIGLMVGECQNFLATYSVFTGYNSVSRIIIEEIQDQDPRCDGNRKIP